jgi:hypothetical protein
MDRPWMNNRRLLLALLAAAEVKGVMPWPEQKFQGFIASRFRSRSRLEEAQKDHDHGESLALEKSA